MHRFRRTAIFFSFLLLSMFPIPGWSSYGPSLLTSHRIPQQAYDACKGKSQGDAVIVTLRRDKLTKMIKAICCQDDDEKQLLAVPEALFKVSNNTAQNHEEIYRQE